ncbi:MAG: DivIVA domain-containing protein [Clostridiaceae bacterium]|nr:DivIVA domain-containing protein [Clostridiaceae bacterium]
MLTPQEIQEQKFEKAVFGGYDMAQIDKFLDVVLNDYTSLYKENTALKAKMRVLVDKIEEYRAVDEELRKTLYNAQIAAKDTVSRAQTEAERILRDAQFAASRNVTDLQAQVTAEEKRLEDAKRANAAYAGKIRRAMELGLRQMEEILSESAAGKAGAEVRQSAPQTEPAPAPQPEPAFRAEPAPAPQPAAAPGDEGVVLDLEVEEEQHARKADPQSDTARIYGDSPFTPKPRFDFNDMRFGKQYDADADQE